ncbi:MAG: NFACT RNA binding domain-containing protein [Pseudomonadota bacterium]
MNLSLTELRQVVEELETRLPGGRIQEIRQPAPAAVCMSLRVPGETLHLRLDATPWAAWIGLTPQKGLTTTPMPHFLARLRHDLTGAAVQTVQIPHGDRVVVLGLSTREGDADLVLELTGHHPNLFLVGPDGIIRDLVVPSRSHQRRLVPGRIYLPPPAPPTGAPGVSRIPAGEPSPAAMVAVLYLAAADEASDEVVRRALLKDLGAALKQTRRTLGKVEGELGRAEEGLGSRELADLLKSRLFEVRKGMEWVEIEDWSRPGTRVRVPLDPRLEPAENLEALYRRYKKARRSLDRIRSRMEELQRRVDALEALRVEGLDAPPERLADLRSQARLRSRGRRVSGGQPEARLPYHVFRSATGLRILVGRSAKDNRLVTFQVARGHDAWMHVRGAPGSHVIIPLARGQEPDSETLLDAAHLAIRYSQAAEDEAAEISWTLRKHVRPAPGGNPGAVFVSREHTLTIRRDPARLHRLNSSRE